MKAKYNAVPDLFAPDGFVAAEMVATRSRPAAGRT